MRLFILSGSFVLKLLDIEESALLVDEDEEDVEEDDDEDEDWDRELLNSIGPLAVAVVLAVVLVLVDTLDEDECFLFSLTALAFCAAKMRELRRTFC
jgi:hypothetical protein